MKVIPLVAAIGIASGLIGSRASDPDVRAVATLDPVLASTPRSGRPVATSRGSAKAAGQTEQPSVTLVVDGRRLNTVGPLIEPKRIVLENGRMRLIWHSQLCEPASFEADVRVGNTWQDATAHCVGDWLYAGGSVYTQPTAVEVLQIDSTGVAIRLRFGNHWIRPHSAGYPSWYVDQPYPFHRTVWLRAGEYGYFTQVVLERKTLFPYSDIEHEVGFGGLWGPARVRTSKLDYRTDTLRSNLWSNLELDVDAAEFSRDGDLVKRILVPLGRIPMISPVFPRTYGGVYAYSLGPTTSYGAYLYAAPPSIAASARALCRFAWKNAPFALPVVPRESIAACGPEPLSAARAEGPQPFASRLR